MPASATPYDFRQQLAIGQKGEARLDAFFSRAYAIKPASAGEQRQEIDRWWTDRTSGKRLAVEYKFDTAAGRTGNAFVETVSVVERGIPGWAYSSHADELIYFVREPDTIYRLRFDRLRQELPRWVKTYKRAQVQTGTYHTQGVLVPLHEFERIAEEVL